MLCFVGKGENLQKSANICENARFVPLGSSPYAHPEFRRTESEQLPCRSAEVKFFSAKGGVKFGMKFW